MDGVNIIALLCDSDNDIALMMKTRHQGGHDITQFGLNYGEPQEMNDMPVTTSLC